MDRLKGTFTGERALYDISNKEIYDSVFEDGESPLKECDHIRVLNSEFRYKYPLWYSHDIECIDVTFLEMSRSGIWYTNNITIRNSDIYAPKLFRRCDGVKIINSTFYKAQETFWGCKNIELENVKAKGDYFCFNCENIKVNNFFLDGNYAFDGAKNIEINKAVLNSKDSFWNTENVVIRDSKIVGEYLGWNSRNLTFINCEISSHQGFCYIDGLKLINCKITDTDLCFELCKNIDATIVGGHVDSIKNPISGRITVNSVGEIILDKRYVDPNKTIIEVMKTNV